MLSRQEISLATRAWVKGWPAELENDPVAYHHHDGEKGLVTFCRSGDFNEEYGEAPGGLISKWLHTGHMRVLPGYLLDSDVMNLMEGRA